MKEVSMKYVYFSTVILVLFFQGCKPFKDISGTVNQRTEIVGVYFNECDSIDSHHAPKKLLWQTIDKKYVAEKAGLNVRIQTTKKNKLLAKLLDGDSVICEKEIKGHFKNDQCYYQRRHFYVVPILPVLWWFENTQTRFYRSHNYLVLDAKSDTGGAIVIMAGGNTTNTKRLYKKVP